MAAVLGTMFFLAVLGFAGWTIVDTLRPRMGRILFLLEYGPMIGAELPPASRVTVRPRPVPARMSGLPLRAAA